MRKKAWFFFFFLLTEMCVLELTHSRSIKFAIKQIIKHVYAISNHETTLGHVSVAYSDIHVDESILTFQVIQCNPNINSE